MNDCIGIDYAVSTGSNRNKDTGIHYGVISQWSLNPDVINDVVFEGADYGEATCPKCGNDAREVFSEEMLGWSYEAGGYKLTDCLDTDVFVLDSPYYTYAQFCSPCVPGACNLDNPLDISDSIYYSQSINNPTTTLSENAKRQTYPRTYALGHDWFENGKAPYRVFRVSDDSEVFAEKAE